MRYVLVLLGLGSLALGIVGYSMHPPIPTSAKSLGVQEAMALVREGAHPRIFVTIDGRAETERPIYTGLAEQPALILRSPHETYPLPAVTRESLPEIATYLGTRVTLPPGEVGPSYLALQGVVDKTLQEDVVSSERILSPVAGTGDLLWALSPVFRGPEQGKIWLQKQGLDGVLTRMEDIEENTATFALSFGLDEIRAAAKENIGTSIPADALVILEGEDTEPGPLVQLPVEGSDGSLLVMPFYEGQPMPDWVGTGPITGVLWTWEGDGQRYRYLSEALGTPRHPRYGVIHHDETAEDLNAKTTFGLRLFGGLGLALIAVGGLRIAMVRRRKARQAG